MMFRRASIAIITSLAIVFGAIGIAGQASAYKSEHGLSHSHPPDCGAGALCTELNDAAKEAAWGGKYVGHDEPAVLFYSNQRNSGNQMQYHFTLPKDPPFVSIPGRTWNFELHTAFWFGMAMCASKSYPEQVRTCQPDSNSNIQPPAKHPGTAFMEMQFYPPGAHIYGGTCPLDKWCAAMNIDSYAADPVNGTQLNASCAHAIGSTEYVNFAFINKNGKTEGPASPIKANAATYTADAKNTLFMNDGDRIVLTMRDIYTGPNSQTDGLHISVKDLTSGESGSTTASKANGFAQVAYAPDPSLQCKNVPYNFHPMYNTSTPQTIVPWAAHTYNIAFSDEIGHFDLCYPQANSDPSETISVGGSCPADYMEGTPSGDRSFADSDDNFCVPAASGSTQYLSVPTLTLPPGLGPGGATSVPFTGCFLNNTGFDGISYQASWPDGNTKLHPTPILFSSPLTGGSFKDNYPQAAFEANLPSIEPFPTCNHVTGAGCSLLPTTDDEAAAAFYPFFSKVNVQGACTWGIGNDIPGGYDFGKNTQYGSLYPSTYLSNGTLITRFENFHNNLKGNPCPYKASSASQKHHAHT